MHNIQPEPVKLLSLLLVVSAMCAGASVAAPATVVQAPTPKAFDIFVDPPTGFVFVKLPTAWKFVGKLSAQETSALPATVFTSLLPAESGDGSQVSSHEAKP